MNLRLKKIKYLLIILICFQAMVFLVSPILISYLFSNKSIVVELFAVVLSLGLPIILILCYTRDNEDPLFEIYNKKIAKKDYIYYIGVIIAISIFINYFFYLIDIIYILNTEDYSIVNTIPKFDLLVFVFTVVAISILPSIFEELCYRGMYYDTFNGLNIGVLLISTIVFSSLHNSLETFINAFVVGWVLMLCYRSHKSIKLTIILHMISNLLSIIYSNIATLPFSPLNILNSYANKAQMGYIVLFYVGMMLLALTCALYLFFKVYKKNEVKKEKLKRCEVVLTSVIIFISVIMFIVRITV